MITSAEMAVWVLTLWNAHVAPFEGGQYQTEQRCRRAGPVQVEALSFVHYRGRLQWKCERKLM